MFLFNESQMNQEERSDTEFNRSIKEMCSSSRHNNIQNIILCDFTNLLTKPINITDMNITVYF
jgi:hypothetical protein